MSEHRKHPAADEEKGILLKAAQKLGLTLSSMEYDGRGTHIAKALKQDSNRKTTSLIAYVTSKHRTGSHKLRVLSKTLERDGLESLYVLSKAGYTEDAKE